MAIQWADDFSRYGSGPGSRTAMLDGLPYAGVQENIEADPDPIVAAAGGRCARIGGTASAFLPNVFRTALPTVVSTTVGTAFRAWIGSLPNDNLARPTLMGFMRGDLTYMVRALVEENGSIRVLARVSDVNNVEVADTVNPVISPASWNHIEMIHNVATGAGSIRLNGVQILTWTGVDTDHNIEHVNATANQGLPSTDIGYRVKDFVIWDGTGSVNNSAMGTVLVRRLKPNADVALGDWVPSTGTTGFNLLAKDAPNDSTYLSANDTLPSADMRFDLENLPADVTSVRGLLTVTRHRKVDGGDGNLQTALSPNGTNWDNGADRPITTTFQYDFDVSELDPATAAAWTPVAVDSAQVRIDRTV